MKIEEIRPEFKILFIDDAGPASTTLCETMKAVGFKLQFFPTTDSAMVAIRHSSPHVIILKYATTSDAFLAQVRKTSSEIQVILMVEEIHFLTAIMKNFSREIFDYLPLPLISSAELLIRLDRVVQNMYLKFENEQLRSRRQPVGSSISNLEFDEGSNENTLDKIYSQMNELTGIKDQEDLIKKYIFRLSGANGNMPVIYFRFLPNQLSFVYGQSIWSPESKVSSLGFKVGSNDQNQLEQLVENPTQFRALREFIFSVFQIEEFSCLVHSNCGNVQGLSIILNKTIEEDKNSANHIYHAYFESIFSRNDLAKQLHSQQTHDTFTGLLSQKYFEEKLDDEVSRARRIQHPVSLIMIKLDNFELLGQKYGEENMLLVLRGLAKSMKKNFRKFDILARTDKNEFSFLLPHTQVKNALMKAEKVRLAFTQSFFPFVKIEDKSKLSLSIGVSEYPSLCSDAQSLVQSCDEALHRVQAQGNRVGAWRAASDFTPDFSLNQSSE